MKFYGQAETVAQRIVDQFKQGTLPRALKQVFINRGDDVPCRSWSWNNQLLVALNGHSDARGFKQWQKVGRKVRKGGRAFHILGPCTRKGTDPVTGEEKLFVFGFRSIPVFGLDQTEGDPIAVDEEAEKWLQDLPLRAVADHWGLSVESYSGEGARALGWYRWGEAIALGTENLSTWAHELCHAADDQNGALQGSPKREKEIVAELGGAVLLAFLGLETEADLGGAWEYVQYQCIESDKPAITHCQRLLKRTCEAVALILDTAAELGAIDPPEPVQESERPELELEPAGAVVQAELF